MKMIILRLLAALVAGAVATFTAGSSFTAPPAKIAVFVGTAVVAFVVFSLNAKKKS